MNMVGNWTVTNAAGLTSIADIVKCLLRWALFCHVITGEQHRALPLMMGMMNMFDLINLTITILLLLL